MTIDDVMERVYKRLKARMYEWDVSEVLEADQAIKDAILALLDAEAEACAALCVQECNRAMDQYTLKEKDPTQRAIYGAMGVTATNCRDAIRDRIAARKGGKHD